jgi:hypothetical protein
MDKKMLALFRKILNLDDKTLPDSISPDQFGKLLENQAGNLEKLEDVKNLHQKLTEKDVQLKKLSAELENKKTDPASDELKKVLKTVTNLNDQIVVMNRDKKIENLKKLYPDISPNLLVDLPDDKLVAVVEEQRGLAKKIYSGADIFTQENYGSVDELDQKIEEVKSNKDLSGIQKTAEVIRLNRLRGELAVN